MKCHHDEHPEWIKQRGDKSFYCTVCRMMIYQQTTLEGFDAEQSGNDRLLQWRRATRSVGLDEHEPRTDGRKAKQNPIFPEDAS